MCTEEVAREESLKSVLFIAYERSLLLVVIGTVEIGVEYERDAFGNRRKRFVIVEAFFFELKKRSLTRIVTCL